MNFNYADYTICCEKVERSCHVMISFTVFTVVENGQCVEGKERERD